MRYAARRDSNETELVGLARMMGWHMVKAPPLDYLGCFKEKWHLIEIKRPEVKGRKREFTPAQLSFFERCKQYGSPWLTWRDADDVMESTRE